MAAKRPNFLIIVADDLGFSDVGCFGGEIRTPNIDKLAANGHRFTDFHAAAACSPTRAMIMSGTDHHIAGLGNLVEWTMKTGDSAKNGSLDPTPQRGMPGYEGYLNERVAALPEVMRDGGYHTIMSGKWHLGLTPKHSPHARGFKRSFAHLPACSNHFGYSPKLDGPPPGFMATTSIPLHMEDDKYVASLPEDWYSSDGYGDIMMRYLKEWKEMNGSGADTPFFAYYPFTAPHWPLQAPQKYIKNYRGHVAYDDGPDALRLRRLESLKKMGLVAEDVVPHPVVGETPEWEDRSPEQRALSARAMECFAGMVECIDVNVGKASIIANLVAVIDYLDSIGELDNTFVCFMSDNGAEGAAYEAYPMIMQSSLMDHLKEFYDNSLENLGNGNSFIWYGERWAQASTAPSRLYKAWTTEGGIRIPFVVKYPRQFEPSDGEARKPITHEFATVMDLAPTIIQMAGLTHPAPIYQGREVVEMRGRSMVPFLQGQQEYIHDVGFVNGWETCGRAAIRKGDWKAVWLPKPKGTEQWQLYDLSKDRGEINDLADQEPGRLKQLLELWDKYVMETGVVTICREQGHFVEAMEEQMPETGWMEYEYWQKDALPGQKDQDKWTMDPPRFQRTVKPF